MKFVYFTHHQIGKIFIIRWRKRKEERERKRERERERERERVWREQERVYDNDV